ncbi:MAG: hypothetical protein FJ295_05350 [Planctomycetes bacterium]|nr:hypothetical protein [Planctomycetota bacterium]
MNSNLWIVAWAVTVGMLPGDRGTLGERRQQLEALSPSQTARLLEQKQTFYALSPPTQERIRAMHETIQLNAKAEQLDRVLRDYCNWLGSLPQDQQQEVKQLPPQQRLEKVKEIVKQQESRHKPEDVLTAIRWLDEFITAHAATITEPLLESPSRIPETWRARIEQAKDANRNFLLYFIHLRQASTKIVPDTADYERLFEELTPSGARELRRDPNDGDRLARLMRWIFQQTAKMPDQITDDEARFYSELPKDEQEKLGNPRTNQFRRRLRELYMNQQLRRGFTRPLGTDRAE